MLMMILISYDISMADNCGKTRLRKIASTLENYGIRVQYSVFECDVYPDEWVKLKNKLLKIYDPKQDSLRFYKLGSNWHNKVEHYGAKPSVKIYEDLLIL